MRAARGSLLALGLAATAANAPAQAADTTQRSDTLSYDDAAAVAYLYNQPAALRSASGVTIAHDQTVNGNVAVRAAPLLVAGHVTGHVVVINGNVTLVSGARIDGDLVVTGGHVQGADTATVGGTMRLYAPRMNYRLEGDLVVALHDESQGLANWFRRWKRRHFRSQNRIILKGGTYDRVEGLPVIVGPTVRQNSSFGSATAEVLGIYRSADGFAWKADNLGYSIHGELQLGFQRAIAIGGEAYDVVQPVESWQLRESEIGLASFFLHRDYRDYFNRKGGRGYLALRDGTRLALTLGLGEERWQPRVTRNPFTLLRNNTTWRDNPVLDAGVFTIASARLDFDTRNDPENPWTGWLIAAEVEHGSSDRVTLGPASPLARPASSDPVPVRYTRGTLDLRRYNRLSPDAQLNLRLLLGGRLSGDPLPLERRFSLGGSGSLPGYDFRQITGAADVLTCSGGTAIPGIPAQCDRMALAQVEFRSNIHLGLFAGVGSSSEASGWSWSFYHPLQWVVFADAGRGWLSHDFAATGQVAGTRSFPSLDTFKTDVGVGLDAEVLGVFVAKSLTDWGNPVRFLVRLRHRF